MATALHETYDDFEFDFWNYNNSGKVDLVAFKKTGGESDSTEVHVLDGDSNFTTWLAHKATILPETGDNFELFMWYWNWWN